MFACCSSCRSISPSGLLARPSLCFVIQIVCERCFCFCRQLCKSGAAQARFEKNGSLLDLLFGVPFVAQQFNLRTGLSVCLPGRTFARQIVSAALSNTLQVYLFLFFFSPLSSQGNLIGNNSYYGSVLSLPLQLQIKVQVSISIEIPVEKPLTLKIQKTSLQVNPVTLESVFDLLLNMTKICSFCHV